MRFLRKLFGGSSAQPEADRRLPQVCLVDAAGLLDPGNRGKNGGGAVSPRDLFNILRGLADFASREAVAMTVFLTGRPLREAPEGGTFKGVKVHYADSADGIAARILETIPGLVSRHEVLVITANPDLDKAALKAGASCMRTATFRKAREDKGDGRGERDNRNGSGQPNHPHGQPNQPRRRHPGQGQGQPSGPNPAQDQPPPPPQPDDDEPSEDERDRQPSAGVQSLIDPL
jgi:hypothetical protein